MVAIVYTTIDNMPDARKIANTLVEEQLVACVNIIPKIESVYKWKGKIETKQMKNSFLFVKQLMLM